MAGSPRAAPCSTVQPRTAPYRGSPVQGRGTGVKRAAHAAALALLKGPCRVRQTVGSLQSCSRANSAMVLPAAERSGVQNNRTAELRAFALRSVNASLAAVADQLALELGNE